MGGVQALDQLQPRRGPVRQPGGVRVPGPHEIPADMRPAVQVHQAVGLLPGRLVNGVEVTGDHRRRGPPSSSAVSWPVSSSIRVPGQHRPGPRRVHHEAHGVRADEHPQPPLPCPPVPRREDPPHRLVRVQGQEPRDRSVTASATGASSAPACAHVPASVAAETSAPCRARPFTSEFWLRPAVNRSTRSIAMNAFVKRPFPPPSAGRAPSPFPAPGNRRPAYNGGGSAPPAARSPASPAAPRTSDHPAA